MNYAPRNDPHFVALREENDTLRERLRQLEEQIGLRTPAPKCFGLGPKQMKLFGMLMKSPLVQRETMMSAMNFSTEEAMRVQICKVRQACKKHGVAVQTSWGLGYFLSPEAKARVRALIEAEAA